MTAHLFDKLYRPLAIDTVMGHAAKVEGLDLVHRNDVALQRQPDGVYRGEFIATEVGPFKFYVDDPGDPEQKKAFSVVEPTTEVGDTNLNETLLKEIARTSAAPTISARKTSTSCRSS